MADEKSPGRIRRWYTKGKEFAKNLYTKGKERASGFYTKHPKKTIALLIGIPIGAVGGWLAAGRGERASKIRAAIRRRYRRLRGLE